MITREDRAIRIAMLLEPDTLIECRDNYPDVLCKRLERKYSSFNGLMQIVERANKGKCDSGGFTIDPFEITVYVDNSRHSHFEIYNQDLIDALQEAIIYYLGN